MVIGHKGKNTRDTGESINLEDSAELPLGEIGDKYIEMIMN